MGSREKKKPRILIDEEDRISELPDELIHKIMAFMDAKEVVQTSVLSRRWKLLWTTLPFLNFGEYKNSLSKNNCKFIRHVLSRRNRQSHLSELNFSVYNKGLRGRLIVNVIEYAIAHNVQSFDLDLSYKHQPYKLSTFSSNSLKKLTLRVKLEEFALGSDCWNLPALTTLHLEHPDSPRSTNSISDSWFTCLPSLRTLGLDNWNLSVSSFSFSFPNLTTLRLYNCALPNKGWDLPAVISLDLYNLNLPYDMSDMLSTLINLQNLTISSAFTQNYFLSCPRQLLNLNIRTSSSYYVNGSGNIVVLAPRICNFTSFGIFTTTFVVPELENVNIRLRSWLHSTEAVYKKIIYHRLINMLPGLVNAKTLTFDSESIEAFNEISSLFVCLPSPFFNLKYVKLPRGYKESNMSCALRSYLLGGSPRATIATTLPQNMLPQTIAVSMMDQNVGLQEPLEATIKELDDSNNIHQTLSVDTVNMNVQEEHVVEDSVSDSVKVRHINDPVEATNKDQASSSQEVRDFGLWQGHKVKTEFVFLLDRIMHAYPETFEHFTTKNKKLCTMNLNMFCTSLNDFAKISMTEVDLEMIVEYRDVFAYLQNQGLDVSWVMNRLNYIEHLRFSKPLIPELHTIDGRIDDAKIKLQELQARVDDARIKLHDLQACVDDAKTKLQDLESLRLKKMTEIEKAFGTMGTNLAVGFIGDYLLSSP